MRYVWSYSSGGDPYGYSYVAISSDDKYVAQGTREGLFVFDNKPSQSKKSLWSYATGIYDTNPAISSNGSYIVGGATNGNIYLFYNEISPKQKEFIISFGTYYLLFLIIGVLSLIIILTKKNNLVGKKET